MPNCTPSVSVVIPTYNTIAYLPYAIESVLRQTFQDFEILVVNDGSTDTTDLWMDQQPDDRIRHIRQANQGLSAARNTGISLAQGRYVALLDADDVWEPTKLEKQVHYLDTHPDIGMVHAWISFIDAEGQSTGRILKTEAEGWAQIHLLHRNDVAVLTAVVRRECFEKVGDFDRTLKSLEDWDMWIRLARDYPIAVIREPLARYRQLRHSMSRNCEVMERSFRQVIDRHFAEAPAHLQPIKAKSYGAAYQCLAWKAIQSGDPNPKLSWNYYTTALRYSPRISTTQDGLKLLLAIQIQKLFPSTSVDRILSSFYMLRRKLNMLF